MTILHYNFKLSHGKGISQIEKHKCIYQKNIFLNDVMAKVRPIWYN